MVQVKLGKRKVKTSSVPKELLKTSCDVGKIKIKTSSVPKELLKTSCDVILEEYE
jgi:hypothetical protein